MRALALLFLFASIVGCTSESPTTTHASAARSADAVGDKPAPSSHSKAPSSAEPPAAGSSSNKEEKPGPVPIDAALPTIDLATPNKKIACDAKASCDFSKGSALAGLSSDKRAPLMVFGAELGPNGTLLFPFVEGVLLAAVVLEGSVEAQPLDASKDTKTLGAWEAVLAPEGFLRMTAKDGPARAVVVVGAQGGGPIEEVMAASAAKHPPIHRTGATRFVDWKKLDDQAWGGGAYHARIGWEPSGDDKPTFVMDTLHFGKDAGVSKHVHDAQWEALVVLAGDGKLVIEGEKPSEVSLVPHTIALVPPNTPHTYEPTGTKPLLAIQIYSPSGPEQRFKKLAGH